MVAALSFVFTAVLLHGVPTRACDTVSAGGINDLPRRDPSQKWNSESVQESLSDTAFNFNWYDAVYNGWQYVMVDSTEKPNYTDCSTYYPVYLRDTHPDISSLTSTAIHKIACRRDYIYPCDIQYTIQIRKCDGVVQYYLPPTKSYTAYCFKKQSQLTVITPDPTDAKLGKVSILPELHFDKVLDEMLPYMKVRCNFNKETSYFYKINWYVDGNFLMTTGPTSNSDLFSIHEEVFKQNNIPMGFDIHCGVGVLGSVDGAETPMTYSERYFVGIKVLNTTIFMDKDESAFVLIKSTVPIGCRYAVTIPDNCTEDFRIFNADVDHYENACKTGVIANKADFENQRCSNGFQTLRDGEPWDPDLIYKFKIITTDINYDDAHVFRLKLEFSNQIGHRIWNRYQFPSVKVIVWDDAVYKGKICYSHIDPHMRTSDQYYYEQQRHGGELYPGTFMLYRNLKYGIEIQQKTKPCNNNKATCACGIAVMAGQDVFMINRCGSINYLDFTRCDDGGILDVIKANDYLYHIFTPIGTKVTVRLYNHRPYFKTMSIDITMAPKDVKNVEGLCGHFDNNDKNDMRHRDGTTDALQKNIPNYKRHHNDFSKSWSLDEIHREENLFLSNKRSLNSWKSRNGLYCVCQSSTKVAEAVCSKTQYLNCTLKDSITENKCRVLNLRKRSTVKSHQKETERLFSLMNNVNIYTNKKTHKRIKREEETYTISEEEAYALCTDKINGSLAFTSYSAVTGGEDPESVINQCLFDVVAGNDTSWATAHVESVSNIVKTMMDKQPTYVANNTEKVEFFMLNTCPGNCSNNGFCTETSKCSCFGFYHGPDCLIDERDPLVIDDIEGGGECDLADGGDCECFHVRSSNVLELFSCKAITSKINHVNKEEQVRSLTFSGGYEDIFTGVCCLQKVNDFDWVETFVVKHDISISNNGESFGNTKHVYVFDSTCQNVQMSSNEERTFTLKIGYCFIDGSCEDENSMSPAGCFACRSATNAYNWTEYNPCQNGGKCISEDQGYKCSCPAGYEGTNCETDIDECVSKPCQNGGICTDLVNGYVCTCADGYYGIHCDIDVNTCDMNKCLNGATCIDSENGRTCSCSAGYKGMNCETNINECDSSPCENSGSCVDGIDMYTCDCMAGYTGNNCETDIDECLLNPCSNGGSCLDGINSYKCICKPGYSGRHCDTDMNECEANPCKNGGRCTDGVNMYRCDCAAGYTGSNCETDIDECSSQPCLNDGICIDNVHGYHCECGEGYYGVDCQTETNDCISNPCLNDGECVDKINGRQCICAQGFEGDGCEINKDDCSSNPCNNGGVCVDGVNMYTCTCSQGYTGLNCESEINECASNPCKNGGRCLDGINTYRCNCEAGYTGPKCETNIKECSSNPCQNNGKCVDSFNKYTCLCVPGYNGRDCETYIDECSSKPCMNGARCLDRVYGYLCECTTGYSGFNCETDDSSPIVTPTVKTTKKHLLMIFNINTSSIDFDDENIRLNIKKELTYYYQHFLGNYFLGLAITSIWYGSVIVEADLQYTSGEAADSLLAKAVTDLVKGDKTMVLLNETVSAVSVEVNNLKVTKNSTSSVESLCVTFVSLSETCDISKCILENDMPICQPEEDKGTFSLVIILAICGSVLLISILTIVCLCILRQKKRRKDDYRFQHVRWENASCHIVNPSFDSDRHFTNMGYSERNTNKY